MKSYPAPSTGIQWQEWAERLVNILNRRDREPLRPSFKMPDDRASATEDGIVMYDPAIGELVFSKNGAWHRIRTNTPV